MGVFNQSSRAAREPTCRSCFSVSLVLQAHILTTNIFLMSLQLLGTVRYERKWRERNEWKIDQGHDVFPTILPHHTSPPYFFGFFIWRKKYYFHLLFEGLSAAHDFTLEPPLAVLSQIVLLHVVRIIWDKLTETAVVLLPRFCTFKTILDSLVYFYTISVHLVS